MARRLVCPALRQEVADRLARHREGEGGEEAQRHPEVGEGCRVERSHRDAEDQNQPGERQRGTQWPSSAPRDNRGGSEGTEE